jgi:hypothetical protein
MFEVRIEGGRRRLIFEYDAKSRYPMNFEL